MSRGGYYGSYMWMISMVECNYGGAFYGEISLSDWDLMIPALRYFPSRKNATCQTGAEDLHPDDSI